jgi:hypothetical protein
MFVQDRSNVAQLDFVDCNFWGKVWMGFAEENFPYLNRNDTTLGSNNPSTSISISVKTTTFDWGVAMCAILMADIGGMGF